MLKVGDHDTHVSKVGPTGELVHKVTVRDKLLGVFHFLMRKKSSKKENLPDDEKAKSAKTEAEAGPNSFEDKQQQVTDMEDKQVPPVEVGADQVHRLAYEYELPTPTYTEELEKRQRNSFRVE